MKRRGDGAGEGWPRSTWSIGEREGGRPQEVPLCVHMNDVMMMKHRLFESIHPPLRHHLADALIVCQRSYLAPEVAEYALIRVAEAVGLEHVHQHVKVY